MKPVIVDVHQVCKSFKKTREQNLLVLDDVNLKLYEGEIVALLGKSGSGKSTLLRIIAGLTEPTSGEVRYRDKPIYEPALGMAMVFQNFALMPWLTVLQNVELGLEALGIPREERRQRALHAIDTIGLDGFESAYPKELSGGMRQRVGVARALVVNPDILLMDEPFSALDVLTADNLKSDLLEVWQAKKTNTHAILLVTHNIEEAVALADRIIVFGANPGHVQAKLRVNLPHPRLTQDEAFRTLVDDIYTIMTRAPVRTDFAAALPPELQAIALGHRLPDVDISELSGLLETIEEAPKDRVDLPELADSLHLDMDDLFQLTEMLQIFGLARISEGDVELTPAGKQFAIADILGRKRLFAQLLLEHVPLARHIRSVLDQEPQHRANEERFLEELERYLSEKEAERVLEVIIDWGRYAEIFAYDYHTGDLNLENPH